MCHLTVTIILCSFADITYLLMQTYNNNNMLAYKFTTVTVYNYQQDYPKRYSFTELELYK